MNQIRTKLSLQAAHVVHSLARPEHAGRRIARSHGGQLAIVAGVQHHLMPVPTQQRHLGIDDGVLAAAIVIPVVHDEYVHAPILGERLFAMSTWRKRVGYHRPHDRRCRIRFINYQRETRNESTGTRWQARAADAGE